VAYNKFFYKNKFSNEPIMSLHRFLLRKPNCSAKGLYVNDEKAFDSIFMI